MCIARPQGGSGGMPPRKILDFRPSEIVSDAFSEYIPRIPQIMQTARLVLEVSTRSAAVKTLTLIIAIANVKYRGFLQVRLGDAVLRMGTACREDSGVTP